MAMSLAVKRPAEDLLEAPFHSLTDSAISSSPLKLLSDVSPARANRGAKRRKDDFPSFIRPSANIYDAGDDSDSGASVADYYHSDDMDDHMIAMATNRKHTAEDARERPPVASAGQKSFPCIWLNGNSPTRLPEEEDKDPEPVVAPTSLNTPQECSTELPQCSATPPPPLEPLPKGTVIIQPSQPSGDENQPPQAPVCSTPKTQVVNPVPVPMKSNGMLHFPGTPVTTPKTPNTLGPKNHINNFLASTGNHGSDSELSLDMNTTTNDADGNGMEVCPECHKVFKRKVYLQRHMEREHWSTAKVFKCEDCAYETKHQSNLSVHRRTHTGERPYHCGACGQRYTQGHLLKSHIRSRHAGNMEFYNLEKKSESTRGRKSLDMKHESLLGVGAHHKQDKISALLQAAAANSAGGLGANPGPLPQMPKFGGGLLNAQYMNSLSYFNSLRPMMGNPLSLTGGLLGNPRFFSLGGLTPPTNGYPQPPNSLMPPLNPSMSLLTSQGQGSIPTSSASENLKKTIEAMDMKPKIDTMDLKSKMNLLANLNAHNHNGGLQVPIKLPEMANIMGQQSKAPVVPQMSPQDLTTKKCPAEADVPEQLSSKHLMSMELGLTEPQDLSNPRYGMVSGASPARPQESDSATIPSQSPRRDGAHSPYTHKKLNHESYGLHTHTLQTEEYMADPSEDEELVKDSSPAPAALTHHHAAHKCDGDSCPHLKKLKDLRRNVFRMLSVFTPDLSFENGISSETDDVDELLYEVIYTNIEEESSAPSKD